MEQVSPIEQQSELCSSSCVKWDTKVQKTISTMEVFIQIPPVKTPVGLSWMNKIPDFSAGGGESFDLKKVNNNYEPCSKTG